MNTNVHIVEVRREDDERIAVLNDGRELRDTGKVVALERQGDGEVHQCPVIVDQHGQHYAWWLYPDEQEFEMIELTSDLKRTRMEMS